MKFKIQEPNVVNFEFRKYGTFFINLKDLHDHQIIKRIDLCKDIKQKFEVKF